ncbi:MAG: MOSC domain-containing protein [Planctomycetota bacterium]
MARIERLWIKPAAGAPMQPVDSLEILAGEGVVNAKPARRHVTLIAQERWAELMEQLNADLDPSTRRANVLLSGVDLTESSGKTIRIGGVELHIAGETKPCSQMEAALPGLEEAMRDRWGGGAWADAVVGGTIRVGDEVAVS